VLSGGREVQGETGIRPPFTLDAAGAVLWLWWGPPWPKTPWWGAPKGTKSQVRVSRRRSHLLACLERRIAGVRVGDVAQRRSAAPLPGLFRPASPGHGPRPSHAEAQTSMRRLLHPPAVSLSRKGPVRSAARRQGAKSLHAGA
jgi:hypothetical protein